MGESYFFGLLKKDSPAQNAFESSWIVKAANNAYMTIVLLLGRLFVAVDLNNSVIYKTVLSPMLKNFEILLAAFIAVMLLAPHNIWQNTYAFLGVVLLMILFAVKTVVDKSARFRVLPLPLLMFVIAFCWGFANSPDKSDALRIFLFFCTSVIFVILISSVLTDEKKLKRFLVIVFAALVIMSLLGVYQGVRGVEVDLSLTDTNLNQGMPGRVFSTVENPNNFAEIIVLFLPLCVAAVLNIKKLSLKIVCALALCIPLVALAMTLSRSGWLAMGVAVLVFILLYNWKLLIPLGVLGIFAIPFLPQSIINRALTIGSLKDSSNTYRLLIWDGSLNMLKDYWVSGIGLGPNNFGLFYPSYALAEAVNARHSHMLYFQVWLEMGIFGFISFLWYGLYVLRSTICTAYRALTPLTKNTAQACIAAICGICVLAAVEYVWFYPRVLFSFFIVVGVAYAVYNMAKETEKNGI